MDGHHLLEKQLMQLIDKLNLKSYIFSIFSLLFLVYMIFYFSPLNFSIQLGNILNNKLFLEKNKYIYLPKDWFVGVVSPNKTRLAVINENFILDNNLNINDLAIRFEREGNSGRVSFPNEKLFKTYLNKKYKEYDNGNCKYRIYGTKNKIYNIYIPEKNALLKFSKYDKSIPVFIKEFCKE